MLNASTDPRAVAWPTAAMPRLGIVSLVVCVLLAYWPAVRCGYIWDDDDYVTANETLRSARGLRRIWTEMGAIPQYYPLVHTGFWLEYHLWRLRPQGYHAVNILLHAGAAVFLYLALCRLRLPGAFPAALLFAVHPVNVESVVWITERKNVQSACLAFLSLWLFLIWEAADGRRDERSPARRRGLYAAALVSFVAALLSKTVVCSLPAVLLLLGWWREGGVPRRRVAMLLPFFVVGAALAGVTVWMERHYVGARGTEWQLSVVERLLVAGRALWFYAGKVLFPYPLCFVYRRWTINAGAAWQYVYPLAFVVVLGGLWGGRRRCGRGPLAAVLIFAGVLMPALGFFDVYPMRYSFVADHFQYHAAPALLAATAAAVTLSVRRLARDQRGARLIGCGILLLLAGAGGMLTWRRCFAYRDAETLWRDTLATNPTAWIAHNNLGNILLKRGQLDLATEWHFRRAIELNPNSGNAFNNLGRLYLLTGRLPAAERALRQALQCRPGDSVVLNNLGSVFAASGRPREALKAYRQALAANPRAADAMLNAAHVLEEAGSLERAAVAYERALRVSPDAAVGWLSLARVQQRLGRWAAAAAILERALTRRPDWPAAARRRARLHAAAPDASVRAPEAAIATAQAARQWPATAVADVLAAAYASQGRLKAAVVAGERAVAAAVAEHLPPAEQAAIAARLAGYRRGEPFRLRAEPPAAAASLPGKP